MVGFYLERFDWYTAVAKDDIFLDWTYMKWTINAYVMAEEGVWPEMSVL